MANDAQNAMVSANRIGVLIAVESIIISGLLVWAQYWVSAYDVYQAYCPPDPIWHISLALAVSYIAVMASVLSILFSALSLTSEKSRWKPRITIALAGFSASLLFLIAAVSAFGLFKRALDGDTQWHPYLPNWFWFTPKNVSWLVLGIVVILLCGWLLLAKQFENILYSKKKAVKSIWIDSL